MVLRVFRHFVPVSVVLLALFEVLTIAIAWDLCLPGTLHAAHAGAPDLTQTLSLQLSIVCGAAMTLIGLYHYKVFLDYRVMVIQTAVGFTLLAPAAFIGVLYWHGALDSTAWFPELYLKATMSWLVCILITRATFLMLADLDVFKARVLVLGTGEKAARIAGLVAENHNRHFVPVAYVHVGSDPMLVRPAAAELSDLDPEAIVRAGRALRANQIVVAPDDRRGLPVRPLLHCRLAGMQVIDYLDFLERETRAVALDALQPGWLIYSDGFRCGAFGTAAKRVFDLVLAFVVLVLTLPIVLLTALLIKIESPGPILYRQERVGLGGPFMVLKFRSMRTDAEKDGTPRWAASNDPRVTRIGNIIRRFRIDELPQLFNVLRGDMSFVGPRPERPFFVNELSRTIPFYAERHSVKPGLTGWAQVNYPYGASFEDARRKLAYDLYYIKNHGLFLDLVIMIQTIHVILSTDGAR